MTQTIEIPKNLQKHLQVLITMQNTINTVYMLCLVGFPIAYFVGLLAFPPAVMGYLAATGLFEVAGGYLMPLLQRRAQAVLYNALNEAADIAALPPGGHA